jgi:hypothetical protein
MNGDFDEDEDPDFEPEWSSFDEDDEEMCADCNHCGSMMDGCSICGYPMCSGCFEMGCGVCKGPHK